MQIQSPSTNVCNQSLNSLNQRTLHENEIQRATTTHSPLVQKSIQSLNSLYERTLADNEVKGAPTIPPPYMVYHLSQVFSNYLKLHMYFINS